jgi:hypothetical protein
MLKFKVSIVSDCGFGDDWEVVASFKHKGNAWKYAVDMRDELGRSARVTDNHGKQVARFDPFDSGPRKCEECGIYPADGGRTCAGCDEYAQHTNIY